MKYYKNSNFAKTIGSTGFITIIACALIAIGAIGWFALSRNSDVGETPSDVSQQEYPSEDNSYNNDTDIPQVSETETVTDVNDNVSDIPYSEETPQQTEEEKITYVLPIEGNVSKGYSDTALQYSATFDDMRLHTGVDILCEVGSNIKAVTQGTVKSIVDDANYGKVVTIEHTGNITVKYCGLGSINVNENDDVNTGDVIGTSGEVPCECADNPHIHIEATVDGEAVSPLKAFGLE